MTAASNLAPPVAALATAPILARGLGVADRGDLAAATAPMLLAVTAATIGVPEALIFFSARRPHVARLMLIRALALLLSVGVGMALLSIAAASWLAGGNGGLRDLIIGLSVLIPPGLAVGAGRGVAMGLHRWRLVALERVIASAARVVLIYGLFVTGHLTVLTAALATTAPNVVAVVAYVPIFRMPRRRAPDGEPGRLSLRADLRSPGVRELTSYGLKAWAGSVSGILLSRLDQAIMVPIAGNVQLGFYTVGTNISDITVLANNAMRDVTVAADAADRKDARLHQTARVSLLVSCLVAVVIAATVWFWIDWVFGAEFHDAAYSVVILVLSAAIATPGSVVGAGLAARGMPGLRSLSLFVAFVGDIIALVILGHWWGSVGAAVATAIGNQAAANLNVYFFKRHFELRRRDIYLVRVADLRVVRENVHALVGAGRARLTRQPMRP